MYCCVYISLTKYALEYLHLLFRISNLSQVTGATSFSFILQRLSTLTQSDTERLLTSMGKRRVGCSTVETGRSLDKRSALSRPSDAQRLWGSMRQWAGLDAQLLHDDWMICLRPNPFLIDSEMSQSAILKAYPSRGFFEVLYSVVLD